MMYRLEIKLENAKIVKPKGKRPLGTPKHNERIIKIGLNRLNSTRSGYGPVIGSYELGNVC
jgi:hypothetical protein